MLVITSTESTDTNSSYIIYLRLLVHQQHMNLQYVCVKLNPPLPLCLLLSISYFRDRALFARLALLHDHGGQFSDGGRAATDARSGRALPQLAGPGRLAGPADRHNQPVRSDAAVRLVSPRPLRKSIAGGEEEKKRRRREEGEGGGQILLTLNQATACTVHTGLHSTEHTPLQRANNALFLLLFFFFPPFFLLLALAHSHILFSSCFVYTFFSSLCAGFFPSLCAGCWPPSTTGGPKP